MLIEMNSVCGGYGSGDIVKDVSLFADKGDVLCLVGPNGCGKTTLFRLILGSVPISRGSIMIDGRDISTLSARELANLVAYIPQYHSPVFEYTVAEVVTMGRASHFSAFESPKAVDREAAFEALRRVNALHLANKKYTSLSGGQRQLVLIARAICQASKLIIMDEPSSNLDYANNSRLTDVILSLAECGYCVLISTHNPEHPFTIGSKVLLMKDGRAERFGRPKDVITAQSLYSVYGIDMDVISVHDRYGKERTICLPVKPSSGTEAENEPK